MSRKQSEPSTHYMCKSSATTDQCIRLDFSESITVLVGDGKKPKQFVVHKCYLTKTSDFLSAALNGAWREAKNGRINLPNVEPRAFECYIQWLYTGEVPVEFGKQGTTNMEVAFVAYDLLMDLYMLGHFLLDAGFQNAVIDSTLKTKRETTIYPGAGSIRQIWDETPEDCTMKRLITRWWVSSCKPTSVEKEKHLPADFQVALLQGFIELRNNNNMLSRPSYDTRCDYHEHDDKLPECD